jgi:hypothetical protein
MLDFGTEDQVKIQLEEPLKIALHIAKPFRQQSIESAALG